MSKILQENLDFLIALENNNNREWFQDNKGVYQRQLDNVALFADALLSKMNEHDHIETPSGKKSLFRIYRDVRFSKDKRPYKTHWSGHFKRATNQLRGGYYFHIQPGGESFIGGGFWGPSKEDLQRIREEIAVDATELRSIIQSKTFIDYFGTLNGDQLKTAPKGFPKDHRNIDLLRYKQFLVWRKFSDKEVLQDDFADQLNEGFKHMRPFFDFMSEVLTTDANGVPLYSD